MISSKLKLILSGIAILISFYVFATNGKSSFNALNIGLFLIFAVSFITALVSYMKDKK
ncbi:hypothetical protein IC218_21295 [Clostridioides sp. ES-S-0005-03]|uniref:hypothetical protein n=1 Tax=unclassified Clostridioides TaxID=2635829 RepID=UPI001D0CB942|nr:hypothetical protein [Clostridioides sp. ES-S-0001-03]MCC0682765.1 hypothetical protein [Clostridioides sp. ES-S-0005-03]MCC0697735.1 hypothetical protein [Clostridioides sp. ES-S-0048-02]